MNKFLTVFVLFAAAICCSAVDREEQEINKEVGLLLGNERLFESFCLKERDIITEDIRNRVAQRTSLVFENFFGAATGITDDIMTVERQAVEEFAKRIASPSQEIDDGPLPEDKIQAMIEQGKRDIDAKGNVFGRFVAAAKSAAGGVLYNAANSAIFVRLAKARAALSGQNLLKEILETCNQVSEYETTIEKDFTQAKEQLKAENTEGEVQKFIDSVTLPSLKCYTVKYITRLNAFCDLFKTGSSPFMKMLGIKSDFKLAQ